MSVSSTLTTTAFHFFFKGVIRALLIYQMNTK